MERSPALSIPDSLELQTGIGLFHIHGHKDSCLPCFSPSYIPGAKQVDGEIIETLWAPLNNISQSIRGMSLAHRQEVLDAHMNHSNWKKMVRIGQSCQSIICIHADGAIHLLVPSLLKRWKQLQSGMQLSAEAFESINKRLKKHTKQWLKADKYAQLNRNVDPSCYVFTGLMDRITSFCLIFLYRDPLPPYHMQMHRTAPFLSPYPLSPLSLIVPCTIKRCLSYHFILVAVLILYDTSAHKAVLLYAWTMSPRLSSFTCSESSASI